MTRKVWVTIGGKPRNPGVSLLDRDLLNASA